MKRRSTHLGLTISLIPLVFGALAISALAAGKRRVDPNRFDLVCSGTLTMNQSQSGKPDETKSVQTTDIYSIDLTAMTWELLGDTIDPGAHPIKSASEEQVVLKEWEHKNGSDDGPHSYSSLNVGFDRRTLAYTNQYDSDSVSGGIYPSSLQTHNSVEATCRKAPFTAF
jgi:hypothetical protein